VNPARIVVDTNILFSLLLRGETALRKRFLTDNAPTFHCPRFVFVELFQHKERIAQATELSEEDLLECLYELLARVHFLEEAAILPMNLKKWSLIIKHLRILRFMGRIAVEEGGIPIGT
jgi:predicted nucleic acid-binding protein